MQYDLTRLRAAITAQHGQPFGSTTIARQLNTNPDRIGQLLALHAQELNITVIRHHPRQYQANARDMQTLGALLGYHLPKRQNAATRIEARHPTGRSFSPSHAPRCHSSAHTMELA